MPVTIVLGLSVGCIPFMCGKQLSQNTVLYMISTMRQWGYFSNGSVFIVARALSFMVHMYLSTSGTCSSHAVVFSIMLSHSRFFLRHSNCPPASICLILNPLALYASIICFSDVIMVDFFSIFDHFCCSEVYVA